LRVLKEFENFTIIAVYIIKETIFIVLCFSIKQNKTPTFYKLSYYKITIVVSVSNCSQDVPCS